MIGSNVRPASAMPDRLKVEDDGTAVLLGTRCRQCGATFLGSVQFCRRCTADDFEPRELSRSGTLVSQTVVMRAAADWTGPTPYALAEVALPEGLLVTSRVSGWRENEALTIGEPMELTAEVVETADDGTPIAVYAWRRRSPA